MATYQSSHTGAEIDAAVAFGKSPDATPAQGSTKGVTSGGVYAALAGKQNTLTFDNSPQSGSSNPVKSSGIYAALQGKQDTLTFDDAPTKASNNPVRSYGIYNSRVPMAGLGVNLLDNWYFVNPVNQRRATSGTAELNDQTRFIDRWVTNAIWQLRPTGLYIETQSGSDQSANIRQRIESDRIPEGSTITISVLFTDNSLLSKSGTVVAANSWQVVEGSTSTSGLAIRYYNSIWEVAFWNGNSNRRIIACKVEFGAQQTLAHLEGTTWVLNSIPDSNAELYKCRRYLQVYVRDSSYGNSEFLPVAFSVTSYGGAARFWFPLVPSMRTTPASVNNYNALAVRTPSDAADISGVTWSTAARSKSGYVFEASSSNFVTGQMYWCSTMVEDQMLIFNAEL